MKLNLGCGRNFHRDWVNLDVAPADPSVIAHDLRNPLPFDSGSAEVIYHSHVLEHIPRERASAFIAECFRVLTPGGLMRVAVPNLEVVAELYLANLRGARAGDPVCKERYEWSVIELLDQVGRQHPDGGEMFKYLCQHPIPAQDYVIERFGHEVASKLPEIRKLCEEGLNYEWIDGQRAKATAEQVGSFRLSGEVHQWMYDSYSLRLLLEAAGFVDVTAVDAFTSGLPEFESYQLDVLPDRSVRKPDSLFMEARKPRQA